jgi:hypothetical protein
MATQAQIRELYRTYLGREPDAAGLEFYSNPQFSLSLIADDIANSAEARQFAQRAAESEAVRAQQYATGNPATEAEVRSAYQDILGRAPDQAGLDFYLQSDFSPEQIRGVLLGSPERQGMAAREYATGTPATEAEIRQIYRDVLGREADKAGLQFYLGSDFSADQIRANIQGSPENMQLATNPAQRAGFTPAQIGPVISPTSNYNYFPTNGPYGAGRFGATINPFFFSAPTSGMQTIPTQPTRQTALGTTGGETTTVNPAPGGGVSGVVGGGTVSGLLTNGSTATTGTTATFDPNTGGVFQGANIVDPIQPGFDLNTGGVSQGTLIVDPISGAVIGTDYSNSLTGGFVPGLVDIGIGATPAIITGSNFIPTFGGQGMLLDFADIPAFGQGGGMLLDYADDLNTR